MKLAHLVFTGIVVISPVFVCGESLLHDFARLHPKPSFETIIDFLHEHRHEQALCNFIKYRIDIEHTNETLQSDWDFLIDLLEKIIAACENNNDPVWIEVFGSPINELYQIVRKGTGLHGNINISTEDHNNISTISIKLSMYHEQIYDEKAWDALFESSLNLIEKAQQCCTDRNNSSIQGLGICTQTILNMNHVTKKLHITLKDATHGKLTLGYKN